MGDKMEDKKRLDPKYLECLAEEEYAQLEGCLVRVLALNGYANDVASDTFYPDMAGKPVVVRIQKAGKESDLHRWMDEWLDPCYPVEIVERGDLPESLGSCWIYGVCRSLDGRLEAGDIYAVVSDLKKIKHIGQRAEKIDIQDIAKRLGAEICEPPERFRHMMGFMRPQGERINGPHTAVEAVEAYDQIADRLADRKAAAERSIVDAENRSAFEALDQMTCDGLEKRLKKSLKMPIDAGQEALRKTDELLARFAQATWKRLVAAHNMDAELQDDFWNWCRGQGINMDNLDLGRLDGEYVDWMTCRMLDPLLDKIAELETRVEELEKRPAKRPVELQRFK